MRKLIICPKISGNTFTLCDYISKNTDIDLKFINHQETLQLDKYQTIILASGIYVGKPHINLIKWIEGLTKEQIPNETKFYILMTWFGRGKSDLDVIEKVNLSLKRININLEDNYATCFGQGMGIIKRGHPDHTDLEKILTWVNKL